MSIGNLKSEGNKGNNFPWQLKVLEGLQCICNQSIPLGDIVEILETQVVLLTAINNNTNGIETLIGISNTRLTAIDNNTNGIEALIGISNSKLTSIDENTILIKTLIDISNSILTSIDVNIENIEVLIEEQVIVLLTQIDTSLNNIEDALTGTFTPGVILASTLTFPYTLVADTYKGYTIIVPPTETIQFQGGTLPAGVYNFSGEGNQKSTAAVLDLPSGTGVIILTSI